MLNQDPLTTMTIILNYHLVGMYSGIKNEKLYLFQKNESLTNGNWQNLQSSAIELDSWSNVPKANNNQVVKLVPNFKFTVLGRIKNLFYSGSKIRIKYKFADGSIKEYRVNILNSANGIWISPLWDDKFFSGKQVSQIMLSTDNPYYLQSRFIANWVVVPINSQVH